MAILAAFSGSLSVTLMLSSSVSSGLEALIFLASCAGVIGDRLSEEITGPVTPGVSTMSAYDFTRCWVKELPWSADVRSSAVAWADTKTCACAE